MKPITTKLKVVLGAATALSFIVSSGAFADDNFSNVIQNGSDNSGLVTQQGAGGNKVGTTSTAARQTGDGLGGDDNVFTFTQDGLRNEIGTGGSGFVQYNHRNLATITQTSINNKVLQVTQTGRAVTATSNTLTIDQGGLVGWNTVSRVTQTRSSSSSSQPGNTTTITQNGTSNIVGDSSVVPGGGGIDQDGYRNSANVVQTGASNRVVNIVQKGDRLSATVSQVGIGNRVNRVDQQGSRHTANIVQNGVSNGTNDFAGSNFPVAWNRLAQGEVWQRGDGNTLNYTVGLGNNNSFGFDQDGSDNQIDGVVSLGSRNQTGVIQDGARNDASFSVVGSSNHIFIDQSSGLFWGGLLGGNDANVVIGVGDRNHIGIVQDGQRNDAEVLITLGSRNDVQIGQTGRNNDAEVSITNGDRNDVNISQASLAFGNSAKVTITSGSWNFVDINQNGTNSADISIRGNYNNHSSSGGFDQPALGKAELITQPLTPGQVIQIGLGNTISYQVGNEYASHRNLFAFYQIGAGNAINGTTNGNDNQVVVVQQGVGNLTSFTQVGNGNVIGVSQ